MKKILFFTICIPLLFNSCKKEEIVEPELSDFGWRLINSERRIDYGYFETRIWNNSYYTYYNKHFTNNEIDITIPSDTNNGYYDVTSSFNGPESLYPQRLWESFHMNDGPTYANYYEWEIQGDIIYLSNLNLPFPDLSIFFPDQWSIGSDEGKFFYTILSFNSNQLILNSKIMMTPRYIAYAQNIIQEDSVLYFEEFTNTLTFRSF